MNMEKYQEVLNEIDTEIERARDNSNQGLVDDLVEKKNALETKLSLIKSKKGKLSKKETKKFRDYLSSLIGHVDKKIHNYRFRIGKNKDEENRLSTKWNNYKNKIEERYTKEGLLYYSMPRISMLTVGAVLVPYFTGPLAVAAGVTLGVCGAVTLGKIAKTMYDRKHGIKPNLQRQYDIKKGSFLSKVKSSWNKMKTNLKSKFILSEKNNVYEVSSPKKEQLIRNIISSNNLANEEVLHIEGDKVDNTIDNNIVKEELRESIPTETIYPNESNVENNSSDNVLVSTSNLNDTNNITYNTVDTLNTVNNKDTVYTDNIINNENTVNTNNIINKDNIVNNDESTYVRKRRVDRFHSDEDDDIVNENTYVRTRRVDRLHNNIKKPSFNEAVKILRDTKETFSKEEKALALDVVAESFGRRKLTHEEMKRELNNANSFNNIEQALRYYGYKVNNGLASKEEMLTYGRLLGQFSGMNLEEDPIDYVSRHEKVKVR